MTTLTKDMSGGSEAKNMIFFAVPLFLSYLLQALYGSVDTIVVGQFASLGDVTGVTQGSQVMNILTQAVSGLSTGGMVLISRYIGAKHEEDLSETIHTLFALFIYTALGSMLLMLVLNRPLIRLLGLPQEAVRPMLLYLTVCELGFIFIFLYNCISAVLQAMGDSRHPLKFVGIACGINVVLDLLFVAVQGMGAAGAALATVISQAISVLLSIRFLRQQEFVFDFRLGSLKIYGSKLRLLLKLGLPYSVQRILVSSSFLAVSGLSNAYGLAASSAAGVVSKINNFATMPFTALNTAIMSMAGQHLGAGRIDRSKRTLGIGLVLCFGIGVSMFALVQLFPAQCLAVFSRDEEMIKVGIPFLRMFALEYMLMPFTFSINGFLAASGNTWMPMVNGLIASLLMRVPLAMLFSGIMGFEGIAFGSALAVAGALISCLFFYFSGMWMHENISDRG